MRKLLLLFVFALVVPAYAADQQCTGLCLQQVACADGSTTSISGVVYAPNGVDPLPNVLVFIPNAPVGAMAPGVSCPVPGQAPSGSPLVGTTTAVDGSFKLTNVPVGTDIPLVIQAGRWRRQLVVSTTTACTDTAFSTRMPRNQTEGDIPLIAVATGSADQVECALRKVGIDDAEFTNPMSTGRIHLYTGSNSKGALIDANTPSQDTLMSDLSNLNRYDVLMLPCQARAYTQSSNYLGNLLSYANGGGRVYASHYSYVWFNTNGPFSGVAGWLGTSQNLADGTATVDTSFASGKTLSDWLQVVGASSSPGQVAISTLRKDISGVVAPTQSYLTLNDPANGNPVMQFTFNTPVGNTTNQCGRVLFNEYHVENPTTSPSGKAFPAECPTTAMTNQEKLLEYSLFDLTNSGGEPTLTPSSADFGSQPVGFTSAAKIFTWTNNSIFSAGVSAATATGDFQVVSNTCAAVKSGASCTIGVTYKPTVTGAATGTLTVASNAKTLTAALTGTGVPALTISTAALGFPNTDVGATVTQTMTVHNTAPGPIVVPTPILTGDYTASTDCGASLSVDGICTVRVTFKPAATGNRTGSITISGPAAVLSGTGIDFSTAVTSTSGDVIAGNSLTVGTNILPISGFAATVTITCTTNAPASTCTPNKTAVIPSAVAGVSVTITTISKYTLIGYGGMGGGALALISLVSGWFLWRKRIQAGPLMRGSFVVALLVACGMVTGCSGKLPSQNAAYTAPGTYTYTVTATDGFLTHSATYSLKVTAN